MQTANVLLALAGKRGETVPKYGVTPAEVAVLRFLHGEDAVYDVDVRDDEVQRTNRQEIERLRQTYSYRNGDKVVSPAISALFPGVGAQVPQKFADLELPEELFIVATRKVETAAVPTEEKRAVADMTVSQMRTYASKFADLDLTGLTRKEDIREAIELHEANMAEAAPKSGSVFE